PRGDPRGHGRPGPGPAAGARAAAAPGRALPGGGGVVPRGRRGRGEARTAPPAGKYYMISVVSKRSGIHPQTLRLSEREGLLKPSRTEGNTRLYSEADLRQLEVILNLTRDLGVNLAGVEIILNMRRKMEQVQGEVAEFVSWVRQELVRADQEGWKERLQEALVKLPPTPAAPPPTDVTPAPVSAVTSGGSKGTPGTP